MNKAEYIAWSLRGARKKRNRRNIEIDSSSDGRVLLKHAPLKHLGELISLSHEKFDADRINQEIDKIPFGNDE